jgi:hypothetical protein
MVGAALTSNSLTRDAGLPLAPATVIVIVSVKNWPALADVALAIHVTVSDPAPTTVAIADEQFVKGRLHMTRRVADARRDAVQLTPGGTVTSTD